jgi:NADH dehydrogenase
MPHAPAAAARESVGGTHQVVIVGGGFGGLAAARALRRAPAQVTLLDRHNYHLFQPLLYQVATGMLSPADIAWPLRAILRRQANTRVLLDEVVGIDMPNRHVVLRDGTLRYDTLIVAGGASHSYFGHDTWAEVAPGLKAIEDATGIRSRLLLAFETAERIADPAARAPWLTFVIVGAGPTGVELAGALAEMCRHVLARDFRAIDPRQAHILLLEGADRVLPPFPPKLSARAKAALETLGVTVKTGAMVTDITPEEVTYRLGGTVERVAARTVLWGAGVQASPLARLLAQATGAALDRAGRVTVRPDLSLPGRPEILAIGDMVHCVQDGAPLPGVAQVAIQQGHYAARLIQRRLRGDPPPAPFRYVDLGSLAVIGRAAAVAHFGRLQLSGLLAWLAWIFVHIMKLVGFRNRVFVFFEWAWHFITWNAAARLITVDFRFPPFLEARAAGTRSAGGSDPIPPPGSTP